jgi:drug/metabolite transporter (DMT)-like permease
MNRADLTILAVAAIWGTTFALLRDTLHILHPVDLMALRFSIAGIVLGAIYAKRLWPVRRQWLRDGAWLGFWLAAGYLTQVIGLATITASRSAFITGTYVVFMPIIAFLVLRAVPNVGEFVGIGFVFGGLVAFSADAGFSPSPGDLWTLGCALSFGIQIVVTNIVVKRNDPIALSVIQIAMGALAGWIIVAARGGLGTPWAEIPWGVLLYLAVVATSLVIALQTWALGRTSPVKATLLFSTEPIFAAVFAGVFYGERMSARELLGAALILAGILATILWGHVRALAELRRPGGN